MLLTVLSLKYFVFHSFINATGFYNFPSVFSLLNTLLLCLSILLVAAGGYVINDILDIESDAINKPEQQIIGKQLSIEKAYNLYYLLTASGIILAYFLAWKSGLMQLVIFHVLCGALLWLYSKFFKSSVLIGNVLIAILSALVPLCYFCFEAYTYLNQYGLIFFNSFGGYFKSDPLKPLLWFTVLFSFFAFVFTIIREIIKDLEDMEGDKKLSGETLPLAFGEKKTLILLRFLLGLTLFAMFYVNYKKINFPPYDQWGFQSYFYLCLVIPCLLLLKFLFAQKVNYTTAGKLVKLILLFGLLSTFISFLLLK